MITTASIKAVYFWEKHPATIDIDPELISYSSLRSYGSEQTHFIKDNIRLKFRSDLGHSARIISFLQINVLGGKTLN